MRRTICSRLVWVVAAAVAGVASPALAGEDTQFWQTINIGLTLPDNFRLSSESVFRSGNARGLYEIEENLMVGYKPSKKVTLWLGYTHDPNYSHGNFTVLERRFRQQVNVDNFAAIGKVKFSGRMRLEERWRENITGTGWRLRPQVKAVAPFVGKTSLTVSHESFINFNSTSFQRVNGYDRMRNAISVAVPLNKKIGVDFGYLNQHAFVRNGPDNSDHVLTMGLNASF